MNIIDLSNIKKGEPLSKEVMESNVAAFRATMRSKELADANPYHPFKNKEIYDRAVKVGFPHGDWIHKLLEEEYKKEESEGEIQTN